IRREGADGKGILLFPFLWGGFLSGTSANKTLTHREGNSILKASFNRRKITAVEDDIICTEKIIAERKTFFLDLKQNARGKVVRITEKVSSNRDRIMVPAEILDDFIAALQDIRETLKQQGE
ncbi:hypothetical protein, partial [Akkermansia sp.]